MSQRGRGNTQGRERSVSRRRGSTRNFFSRDVVDEQVQRDNRERENIRLNSTRAERVPQTPVSTITANIDKGKKFISNFFQGFSSEKRSNIQVTMDNSFPTRIAQPYADAIEEFIYSEDSLEPTDDRGVDYYSKFIGIAHIATATKLNKAAPLNEKTANSTISALNSEIRLPVKMGTLIDQVGKTDLPNDNRVRLETQHLLVKQQLIRGMYMYLGEELKNYIYDRTEAGFQMIKAMAEDMDKLKCMIDNKPISVEFLKLYGRSRFKETSDTNFDFQMDDTTYSFRIPSFDFEQEHTPASIKEYLSNSIFTAFTWTQTELNLILGSLVFQVAKPNWIRNADKKMQVLDTAFEDTPIAELTFGQIMIGANVYNINWILNDEDINNIVIAIIHNWNTSKAPKFSKIMMMTDFKFSEFGTDSQLVQLENLGGVGNNQFGLRNYKFTRKNKAMTTLKTTEHGAIMGIMSGYVLDVKVENNININFNNTNDNILKEYIRSDFVVKL